MKKELKEKELEMTEKDLEEFKSAKNYQEQIRIILDHSQQNQKRLIIRRNRKMEENQKQVEKEMMELNQQFTEFLHTKGIKSKFKLAFSNMAESARKQHEKDVKNFNEIKNSQENKDFVEFLHTKGIKAKFHLVIENIKRGIKEAPEKTAKQIANTRVNVYNSYSRKQVNNEEVTAEMLAKEFNEFLKLKGLESKFKVEISEE